MTQSTLRFLIGGLITTCLLAGLARGNDMNIAGFRGVAGAAESTKKQLRAGDTFLACAVDLEQPWSTRIQPSTLAQVMRVDYGVAGIAWPLPSEIKTTSFTANSRHAQIDETDRKKQIASLMKQYREFYKARKYQQAEIAAIKAQELDPDNYVIAAAVQTAHIANKHLREAPRNGDKQFQGLGAEDPGPAVGIITGKPESGILKTKAHINQILDSQIPAFDYHETPLQQILDDLASWSQVNIIPDAPALKAAEISLDQRVSMCMEGATLKLALNSALQKAHLKYEVENDALLIMPAGLVRPGLDCFTDPDRSANPGEPFDLSSNGLKRLGVALATSDRPHLPRSAAAFAATKTVDCPIELIHISHGLSGFGGVHLQFNPVPKDPS